MLLPHYYTGLVEAGVDEAGRGCLAGPVYAAAVILPTDYSHPLLNDSKQLTDRQRRRLRIDIERDAIAWAVGICSPQDIDQMNILNASITAMHRALDQLADYSGQCYFAADDNGLGCLAADYSGLDSLAADNNGQTRLATDYSGLDSLATDNNGLARLAADYSRLGSSSDAIKFCPLSSDAKQQSPLSSDAKKFSPMSSDAKENSPMSSDAKKNSPLSSDAKENSPLSSVAKENSPMSSDAKQLSPMYPQAVIVDGNRFKPWRDKPYTTIVKGDGKYLAIAAASILAKTYRDDCMIALSEQFPQYGWQQNKGYPTQQHREAIRQYGLTVHHRRSFNQLGVTQLELPFQ